MPIAADVPQILARPLAEHEKALAEFVEAVNALSSSDWNHAMHAGKWSPAEIVEHVRLSFDVHRDALQGGPGARPVLTGWKAAAARWFVMPKILRTGRFPRNARAPREIRPTASSGSRGEGLARLRASASAFEEACQAVSDPASRRIVHPYFGALPLPTALRLLARHTRNHRNQLRNFTVIP
jgi:hypothetical protein